MPHISLVFREMWGTTNVNPWFLRGLKRCGLGEVAPVQQLLSPGSTALPFVISTEAQRSGEICGSAVLPWECFPAERGVLEGPAVPFAYQRPQLRLM